jgi:hypothetical protein
MISGNPAASASAPAQRGDAVKFSAHTVRRPHPANPTRQVDGAREFVPDLISHYPRNADATWFRQCFQSRGHVDAVAKDVVLLDNHVAEIDPNPKSDALVLGRFGVANCHSTLDLRSTAYCVHDTGKFGKQAVAGVLYDPAPVLFDLRLNELSEMGFEAFVCPLLISTHQPRVAGHISGKDRGETTGRGHGWGGPRWSKVPFA